MKKAIAVILSIILALGACGLFASAEDKQEWDGLPMIMVAGYSSSPLLRYNPDGTVDRVWGLDFDAVLGTVLSKTAQIAAGLGSWILYSPDYLAKVVGDALPEVLGFLRCNPDGTSVYDIRPYYITPDSCDVEKCCAEWLLENMDAGLLPEPDVSAELWEVCGTENFYYCYCDFRMSAESCAANLNSLVEAVCGHTGSDRVNIVSISHGGQVTATYLNLYGDRGRVENATLIVPAIGGAALAADAFAEHIEFDEETLLYFIETGFMLEEDYNWLVRANKLGFLDDLIDALIPYIYDEVLLYWPSLWDFVPAELYEEYKARLLDPAGSAELIRQCDRMHYEIMPSMTRRFGELRENGSNISILAGYDIHSVAGYDCNSDAIITTNASTGAKVADWGYRFADGYVCDGSVCADSSHDHVSPSMTVDVSCGYLPDNTWMVSGFFHGMELFDTYTDSLFRKLAYGGLENVYSDPEYPQFHVSTNPSYAVFAAFDDSAEGRLSGADTALVVRNLTTKYRMKIISAEVKGADFTLGRCRSYIAPGESVSLAVSGDIPAASRKNIEITVNYRLLGNVTPVGTRTFDFTVSNGEAVPFDSANPLVSARFPTYFDDEYNSDFAEVLSFLGVRELVEMFYNIFRSVVDMLSALCGTGR